MVGKGENTRLIFSWPFKFRSNILFCLFVLGQILFYLFLYVYERPYVCVCCFSSLKKNEILGNFWVWLRLTPVSSCVSCVGLLVQDLTDTILSSYAFKSHYLLTESNRAELKLPMIPSPSSATKKNVGKGNCTVFLFLFCPAGLHLCCACSPGQSWSMCASFNSKLCNVMNWSAIELILMQTDVK